MSDKTVWEKASRLMAQDKVGARIAELRNNAALQSSINREHETEKLERVYEKALYGDDMQIERDAVGNPVYVNPDAGPGEMKIPKVRITKPNLSAAVRAREAKQRHNGLLVDPAGKVDRKDPVITRPPVSGEITRLPPMDGRIDDLY